jgi:hypothetical protein
VRAVIDRSRTDLLTFLRAYHKTQRWMAATDAEGIVDVIGKHFSDVDRDVLVESVASYKQIGNWSTHPAIPRASFERAVDMAMASPDLTGVRQRYSYEQCCDDSMAREAAGS